MNAVLGTPLHAAEDDDRSTTLLVSDLHVPREGGRVLEQLEALLARARSTPDCRVVVLGDLFEFYFGAAQHRMGGWARLVGFLRETTAAGVPVTVLHGNRDFLLGAAFARETGCRVVPGGLDLELAGRRARLLHGDELVLDDLAYQRSKKVLRHPLVRWLARTLPGPVVGAAARGIRRRSEATEHPADDPRLAPVDVAVAGALEGRDLLVFGHVHRAARGRHGAGEYCVLPAFDETGVHLRAGPEGMGYCRYTGERVADPEPWDFPSRRD